MTIRWLDTMSDEDITFIKRFILASGSLKELARQYGVSYPTLRIRLDRLIEKVKVCEEPGTDDPFIVKVRLLTVEGHLSTGIAKQIIQEYEKSLKEVRQ